MNISIDYIEKHYVRTFRPMCTKVMRDVRIPGYGWCSDLSVQCYRPHVHQSYIDQPRII